MKQIIPKAGMRFYWSGLHGSSSSHAICEAAKQHDGPVVVVAPNVAGLNQLAHELHFFAERKLEILTFPDCETLPYDHFSPHQDIISERLLTLYKLLSLQQGILLVSVTTLMQRLPPRDYLEKHSLVLNLHEELDLTKLRNDLNRKGYYCVNQVIQHGEFAIRGSIIDLFPMGSSLPYRIDLFDNEIDSIREFDPETQCSLREIESINLLPAREFPLTKTAIAEFQQRWQENFSSDPSNCPTYQNISSGITSPGIEYYLPLFFEQLNTLFDYIATNALFVQTTNLMAPSENFWHDINQRYEQLRYDITHPLLAPNEIFAPVEQLFANFKPFAEVQIAEKRSGAIDFATKKLPDLTLDNKAKQPLAKLHKFLQSTKDRVLFSAESAGRREALLELLQRIDIKPAFYSSWHEFLADNKPYGIAIAQLEHGLWLEHKVVIPESLLFSQQVMQRRLRQKQQQDNEAVVRDLIELKIDDPVVHIEHGIGRYKGLQTLTVDDQETEFLSIEYADADKLYVPIASLQLISRYMGASSDTAPLNHLGSKQWEKAKRKAAEKVNDVAAELLDIYARRAAKTGYAFTQVLDQYQSFTSTFPFETTIDQQNAIDQVIQDMISQRCMDRLICGDVGFGKTEVAMRATFIAAQNNKQVVILVPTTLLAQQHYDNFQDRFAAWPINIAMLSRFNTPKQQQETVAKLKTGKIDIVIGTHKLLQSGIEFKDLGLLIVDEEHRFGVKQKEKIKSLRANIDILTLTATPIPRTLNMALASIRDMSIIATPPEKRLSIKTFVQEYNKSLIVEAISRETMRGGQVYFIHNDISSIEKIAARLQESIPSARIKTAHGQMRERQLEQIMSDFYHARFNVLVCTTIIESGIDVPTANTIVINRADRFGLAQLHQLRGRVGRSHHQAYAYLLVNSKKDLTKDAAKRLAAIESMEDLGAGFTLATHDLEIRGAGEILGEEQSGQIHAIGYNLYMEFLDRAVSALKAGKQPELEKPFQYGTEIDLHIPAFIPENYVYDVHTRLTLYKRIASAKDNTALHELQVELIDRFGLLPQQTKNLFTITELKLTAESLDINKIKSGKEQGYIEFEEAPKIEPLIIIKLIQKHPDIYKLEGSHKLKFKIPKGSSPIDAVTKLLDRLCNGVNG